MARGLAEKQGKQIAAARGGKPYLSAEELWRRASVPVAALERLALADAFRSLKMRRRDAAWAFKALRDDPMPLFAAADRGAERPRPELREPAVSLPAMTAGR
jgi:error-prone DNA polymerase